MDIATDTTSVGNPFATPAEALEHYGVKGMHWGVRKAEDGGGRPSFRERRSAQYRQHAGRNERIATGTATKKDWVHQGLIAASTGSPVGAIFLTKPVAGLLAKRYNHVADKIDAKIEKKNRKNEAVAAHKKWKEEAGGTEMANKVFQKALKDFEKTADIINNDPNYKGKDVTKGTLAKQYQGTMNHYFNEHMAQASVDLTLNDKGRAYIYQFDARTQLMKGTEHQMVVEHAEEGGFKMPDYKVEVDELGHWVGFSLAGELKHYGVKGMRWGYTTANGVTTPTGSSVKTSVLARGSKDVTVTQRKAGTFVKTKGGERQKASTDAVKTQATRQVAKKSTTDALSTKELKDAIERMRLEQEFAKLDKKVTRKGQGLIKFLFTPQPPVNNQGKNKNN